MNDLYVGDLVAHVGDRNVVGHVVSTTQSTGGLHPPTSLDVWGAGTGPRFTNSGLVPVRWNTDDGVPYVWWEAPAFLEVIRPALRRSQHARREPCSTEAR